MNEIAHIQKAPLVAGQAVGAIIPRTVEEMWRVAQMVTVAGLAPDALVKDKWKDKEANAAISAVATCIMAGAELGLPPMVSLRSFTVIGGKPALYGDGLINVCRRSGRAAYIRTGYDEEREVGWCEAKRSDTGEESRVEFSKQEAIRAGLWDDRPTVQRKSKDGGKYEVPNDAPWHRYPTRMLKWRAAGYCLRELFADVLGGMPTDDEAREIHGFDSFEEPVAATHQLSAPPPPPPPPAVSDGEAKAPAPPEEPGESTALDDAKALLDEIEDADELHSAWSQIDLNDLTEDEAEDLKAHYYTILQRIDPNPLGAG